MLSLLLKTAPLAGRTPHRFMNAPDEKVSAPLWIVTNFISFVYNGAISLRGAPSARKRAPKVSGSTPPAYEMLSQYCRASLVRRAPFRFINGPLEPGWCTTVS